MTLMGRLDEMARQRALRSLRYLVKAPGTRVPAVAKNFFRLPSIPPYYWDGPGITGETHPYGAAGGTHHTRGSQKTFFIRLPSRLITIVGESAGSS
jgi:hypothetical protein